MRERIARAVADPSKPASLIKHNVKAGTTSVVEAVVDDEPFFVRLRPGLVVLDFDRGDAVDLANRAYVRLLLGGYSPVLCASGQGDRRHVFCRGPVEQLRRLVGEELLACADQGFRDSIRPPLTAHSSGLGRSTLLSPADPSAALRRLIGQGGIRPLGRKARSLLGKTTVNDASQAIFGVAVGGANAGWSEEDLGIVLTCSEVPLSNVFAGRVERRKWTTVVRWLLEYIWPGAQSYVADNPARWDEATQPAVLRAAAWALSNPWPGVAGASDFAVFMGFLCKQDQCGRSPFDLDQRTLMEFSGISSRATIERALERLETATDGRPRLVTGKRRENSREHLTHATTWELTEVDSSDFTISPETLLDVFRAVQSDAFRNGRGLGKVAGLVYCQLVVHGLLTVAALATRTGSSSRTIGVHLRLMANEGMVEQVGKEWSVTDRDLDCVAKELPSYGRGEEIREDNRRQRMARDIKVATFDPRKN